MDNYTIADNFSLLSKLMDIHGENSFKTKSYSIAAFTIEKLPVQLSELPREKIFAIKGIGDAIGQKIIEQLETGKLGLLDKYLAETPPGIIEMLGIKGIGPKKIATIWKDLEVESIGELLYACNENRLMLYKGFGEKTQNNIRESIEFYLNNQGSFLYAQIETTAHAIESALKEKFKEYLLLPAGDFRRDMEVIDKLEWITTVPYNLLADFLKEKNLEGTQTENLAIFKGLDKLSLCFYITSPEEAYKKQFFESCSKQFLDKWTAKFPFIDSGSFKSEEDIFLEVGAEFIPPPLRENENVILLATEHRLPELIKVSDITGIIHCHSKWSDGANSIEEMALAAIQMGLQFMVISDHSKSAFYANGLSEERIYSQHKEIEELNLKFQPFKIFKSIESDILNDGNLDYNTEILALFDLVIASIHSNLKMNEEKAMQRLIKSIENPYTSILGHMTGRLLLSRNGYPVDHKKIIDACAANNVVIELNAHPRRLDIDWRYIDYALSKDVLISIDPDSHSTSGYEDLKYGVLSARKAGVSRSQNLSSHTLEQFEQFLRKQHLKRG